MKSKIQWKEAVENTLLLGAKGNILFCIDTYEDGYCVRIVGMTNSIIYKGELLLLKQ